MLLHQFPPGVCSSGFLYLFFISGVSLFLASVAFNRSICDKKKKYSGDIEKFVDICFGKEFR